MTFDPVRETPTTAAVPASDPFTPTPRQPVSDWQPTLAPPIYGPNDTLSSYLPQNQPEPSVPKGDYSKVGKFSIGLGLPAPWVSPLRQDVPQPQDGFVQLQQQAPGVFESVLRGVEMLPGQFLPGYINDHVNNLFGLVGSVPDTVLRQFGTINELPGGGDIARNYAILPDSAEKQRYNEAVARDPVNRLHYMAQYLRTQEKEWASETGRNRLLSGFDLPSESLGEQVSRLLGGLLGTSGLAARRTYVGSTFRDVRGTVVNAPAGTLPADLEYLRTEYLNSGQTEKDYENLLDDLASSRWAWTNDPGLVGSFASLASDILTDPATWLTFGTGKAAAIAARGSVGLRAMRAVRILADEDPALLRSFAERGIRDQAAITAELKRVRPDIIQRATDTLTRRQQAVVSIEPVVNAAAAVSNRMMDPFQWFGAGPVGSALTGFFSTRAMDGMVNAMGAGRLRSYANTAGRFSGTDRMQKAMATANSYLANSVASRSLAKDLTESIGPSIGDATAPEVIAVRRAVGTVESEVEDLYREVQYQAGIPTGRSGPEAMAAKLEQDREFARAAYQDLTGADKDTAVREAAKFDDQDIAALHMLNYGRAINDFAPAKDQTIREYEEKLARTDPADTKAVAKVQGQIDRRKRYTLIGPRELTDDRATVLLAKANDGDADAIRAAIAQYPMLAAHFRGERMADANLLSKARLVLADLLDEGDSTGSRLVHLVPDDALDPATKLWRQHEKSRYGDYSYKVGVAPADTWGIVRDEDGVAVAAHPWVDAAPADGKAFIPRKMDEVRLGMFTHIRGNRLLYEAKREFIRLGVERNLTPGESESLYHAIRKAADSARVGTRGLQPDQLWEISGSVNIPAYVRNNIGERGLSWMVAKAFEGDLRTVGATSKLSGKMKLGFRGRMLNVGFVAENLYPKLRFYASPFFQAQEIIEGPFLNIMRGVGPGFGKWSERDKKLLDLLASINTHERYTDQYEMLLFASAGGKEARRVGGSGTRLEGVVSKINVDGLTAGRGVASMKQQNYVRQFGVEAGLAFRDAVESINPGEYDRMTAHFGTVEPVDVMLHYFAEKGLGREEDPRWGAFMLDITKPSGMGKEANILLGDHARAMGFASTADLRMAVRNKDFIRAQFDEAYDLLTADPAYKERVWTYLNAPSRPELRQLWQDELVAGGLSNTKAKQTVDAHMRTFNEASKAVGMRLDDWLPNRFATLDDAKAWVAARDGMGADPAAMWAHFAPEIQESGRLRIREAYAAEKGADPGWTPEVIAWAGSKFDDFATSGDAPNPTMHQVFTAYARYADGVMPEGVSRETFKTVIEREKNTPGATFDADEHRVWESIRHALLSTEDQAQKTHFYARGRNWVERSLNHPYLGIYPLSYMWGKMVPEMVRFLVKKPFGIQAPLGGLLLAKHVWTNVQLQVQTDPELRKWLDEHPELIRFFSLMTPGSPFELPVNLPVFARRALQNNLENQAKGPGEQEVAFDSLKAIQDSVSYSFGLGHFFDQVNAIGQELNPLGQQPTPDVGSGTGTDAMSQLLQRAQGG